MENHKMKNELLIQIGRRLSNMRQPLYFDRLSFARRDPAPYRHGRAKESEHSDIKTTGGTFKNH